jgi:hypothetical protein
VSYIGRNGASNENDSLKAYARRAVVYLYLVNYGRSRPDEVAYAISGFLSVSHR